MPVKFYPNVVQGSDEWLEMRRGLLTASEMKHAISKKTDRKTGEVTFKVPDDDKSWSHVYELAGQRLGGFVEASYQSDDMLRGVNDEQDAKILYATNYLEKMSDLQTPGFVTNDKWGFTLGYSPDGIVLPDGAIECKGRRQKYQIETVIGALTDGSIPDEYMIQLQTGMLVAELKWIDFISFCGGHDMMTLRVKPDPVLQTAILESAAVFHDRLEQAMSTYRARDSAPGIRFIPTVRRVEEAMI